jgi:hypothetical protein
MAYRKAAPKKQFYAKSSSSPAYRSKPKRNSGGKSGSNGGAGRVQTVRIVLEQPAGGTARVAGAAVTPRKAQF